MSGERRFFAKESDIKLDDNGKGSIVLREQDAAHIAAVLRLQPGARIFVSDGTNRLYEVELTQVSRETVAGQVIAVEKAPLRGAVLTVFQGLPKAKKMDFIVEKLTEVGADNIVPVKMARSIAEYEDKRAAKKLERWRAIAEEAAKQSRRVTIPAVNDIAVWKAALGDMAGLDVMIAPWEDETGKTVADAVKEAILVWRDAVGGTGKSAVECDEPMFKIGIVIGPEGGFTDAEIAEARAAGARTVTLGPNILRTETAGIVAAALALAAISEPEFQH